MTTGRSKGGPNSRGKGGVGRGLGGGRGRGLRRGGGRGRQIAGRGTVLPSVFRADRKAEADGGRGRRGKSSRNRENTGHVFEDDEDEERDRHKYDDEAGDSDDLPDPDDSDFEDEELDEDEAFDSADEEKYGEIMETILERKTGKKGGGDDEEEEEDYEEDEGEDDGGISLMDMLNANEVAAAGARATRENSSSVTTAGPKRKGKEKGKGKGKGKAGAVTNIPEKSDESADDAKTGGDVVEKFSKTEVKKSDWNNKDSVVESEMEDSDEDEEDSEGEEGQHERLIDFVGSLGEKAEAAARAVEERRASQMMEEGEFNATSVARGGDRAGQVLGKGGVTMEALIGSLQNSKGFGAVKKQVAAFSGKSAAPSAPVHKVVELRAEREAAYAERKSDMSKWVAPVQANRQAETLDFTPLVKINLSNAALASKLEASTELEKEVEMLLTAGGASEAGLAEKEMEELKSKAYTVQEVQERQAELSKMRALMFYQERKQYHINKIKSKVYRKIKKRQKERAREGGEGDDGEETEIAARKRAEERISLRHKNTTKWVKKALRAKGGAGQDDRKAISEQLRLGQELRAKMDHPGDNSSSEEEESSDEGYGEGQEGEGGAAAKRKPALRESDRRELEDIGGEEDGNDGITGKGAALLKMAFMQRAMDKQRARAKEEASFLLRELEEASAAAAKEDDSDADTRVTDRHKKSSGQSDRLGKRGPDSSPLGGGSNASARDVSNEERVRAAEEMAEALPVGTLRPSAVGMDSRARSSVSAPITIDLGGSSDSHGRSDSTSVAATGGDAVGQDGKAEVQALKDDAVEGLRTAEVSTLSDMDPATEGLGGSKNGNGDGGSVAHVSDDGDEEIEEGNPWLVPTPRRSRERRRASAANGEVLLDVGKAAVTALSAFGGALSEGGDRDSGVDDKERKRNVAAGNLRADDGAVESNSGGDGGDSAVAESDSIGLQMNNNPKKRKKRQVGGDCRDNDSAIVASEGGVSERQENQESTETRMKGKKNRGRSERKANTVQENLEAPVAKSRSNGVGEEVGSASIEDGGRGGTEFKENQKAKRKKKKMKRVEDGDEAGGRADDKGIKAAFSGTKAAISTSKASGVNGLNSEREVKTEAAGSEKESGAKRVKRARDANGDATTATGELAGLSNDELVRRAFAAPDFEAEFKASKGNEIEAEVAGQGREKLPKEMAGWGSWAGEGAPVASGPTKRQIIALKEQKEKEEKIKRARKDARLPKVVINEKRQKRSAKYMVAKVPYPFTSREQYERSLRQPIGGEWNTSQSVRDMTRPSVLVRAGTVVAPMKLGKLERKAGDEQAAAMAKGRGGKRTGGSGRGGKATGKHRSIK